MEYHGYVCIYIYICIHISNDIYNYTVHIYIYIQRDFNDPMRIWHWDIVEWHMGWHIGYIIMGEETNHVIAIWWFGESPSSKILLIVIHKTSFNWRDSVNEVHGPHLRFHSQIQPEKTQRLGSCHPNTPLEAGMVSEFREVVFTNKNHKYLDVQSQRLKDKIGFHLGVSRASAQWRWEKNIWNPHLLDKSPGFVQKWRIPYDTPIYWPP